MNIKVGVSLGLYTDEDVLESKIEALEDYILQANKKAVEVNQTGQGHLLVEDEVYDLLVEELQELKSDSPVLMELWDKDIVSDMSDDENMLYFLSEHPMKSINTIKSLESKPYQNFLSLFPYEDTEVLLEGKLNGHGIRVVYTNGDFYKASSRARGTNGRDLTRVVRNILNKYGLNHIEALEDSEITELRGELVMNSNVFEANRKIINAISPLFAVTSLSRDSASDEEMSLLDFIPYRLYSLDNEGNEVKFDSRTEEFECLYDLGFNPDNNAPLLPTLTVEVNKQKLDNEDSVLELLEEFQEVVQDFEDEYNFGYYMDGVVLEVNNAEDFNTMGADIKYDYGNVALKIGYWNQTAYRGYVQMLRWTVGKSKITPTAVVSENPDDVIFEYEGELYQGYDELNEVLDIENYEGDLWNLVSNKEDLGVETANGSKVKKVPIYEPNNIFRLQIKIGSLLSFNFGGEAGVVPLTEDGSPLPR